MVQISRFYRETLHGRMKERLELSENDRVLDRVLEVGPSSRNPDCFSHRGPKWAELGHHEVVGLGLAEVGLISEVGFFFLILNLVLNLVRI